MARVLSFDFKGGHYFIGGEEVELTDCLETGPSGTFDPADVIFGTGWTRDLADFGEGDWGNVGHLTDAAFAMLSPYLLDGGVSVRAVFTLAVGGAVTFDTRAGVAVVFRETATVAGWFVAPSLHDSNSSPDLDFFSQIGNFSDYPNGATQYTLTEARHCVAASFNADGMAVSVDGGAVTDSAAVPEEFAFEHAYVSVSVGGNYDETNPSAAMSAATTLEKIEFYAGGTGGGGFGGGDSGELPEMSEPNPDGAGDGLTDDSVQMRSWTFSLDGHDFAVFRLGPTASLVYDLTTNSWSEWASPSLDYFRAHIGQNWLGAGAATLASGSDIVCGDSSSGVLFILDPEYGRDDRSTTGSDYFERVVTGGLSVSGRDVVPCGAVTVDCSVGAPTQTDAAMTLEISDDFGHVFTDAGSVTVANGDRDAVVEWRALGTIKAPGRVFRLTDNGATVRIAGLNLR